MAPKKLAVPKPTTAKAGKASPPRVAAIKSVPAKSPVVAKPKPRASSPAASLPVRRPTRDGDSSPASIVLQSPMDSPGSSALHSPASPAFKSPPSSIPISGPPAPSLQTQLLSPASVPDTPSTARPEGQDNVNLEAQPDVTREIAINVSESGSSSTSGDGQPSPRAPDRLQLPLQSEILLSPDGETIFPTVSIQDGVDVFETIAEEATISQQLAPFIKDEKHDEAVAYLREEIEKLRHETEELRREEQEYDNEIRKLNGELETLRSSGAEEQKKTLKKAYDYLCKWRESVREDVVLMLLEEKSKREQHVNVFQATLDAMVSEQARLKKEHSYEVWRADERLSKCMKGCENDFARLQSSLARSRNPISNANDLNMRRESWDEATRYLSIRLQDFAAATEQAPGPSDSPVAR